MRWVTVGSLLKGIQDLPSNIEQRMNEHNDQKAKELVDHICGHTSRSDDDSPSSLRSIDSQGGLPTWRRPK